MMERTLLNRMRKYAKAAFDRDPMNGYCHPSHVAASALRQAEEYFGTYATVQTHGVEGFIEYGGCTYLNTGDGYTPTVYFRKGRFYVGAWADIVEAHS